MKLHKLAGTEGCCKEEANRMPKKIVMMVTQTKKVLNRTSRANAGYRQPRRKPIFPRHNSPSSLHLSRSQLQGIFSPLILPTPMRKTNCQKAPFRVWVHERICSVSGGKLLSLKDNFDFKEVGHIHTCRFLLLANYEAK